MKFLRAFRVFNLCLLIITQAIFYFAIPARSTLLNDLALKDHTILWTLFLITALICSIGYMYNDLCDIETDRINNKVSSATLYPNLKTILFSVIAICSVLCIGLAWYVDALALLLLLPCSLIILYLYSKYLQKWSTVGNLFVSLLTASSLGIIYLLPTQLISQAHTLPYQTWGILFIVFAFLISWIREISKDVEDIEGDKHENYKTIVIEIGIERVKIVLYFLAGILLLIELLFLFYLGECLIILPILFLILIPPHLLYLLSLISHLHKPLLPRKISTQCKIHMGLGVIFLAVSIFVPC